MLSRCALGSMVGHLGAVLEDMGFCEFREPMRAMLPELKKLRDSFNEENSTPDGFAEALVERIPVIYSLANMRSASMRWKFQINENAKMVAFFGTIPGFNHNEIIGWTEDKTSADFVPVVIYDDGASEVLRYMTDSTLGVLMDKGLDVQVYHVRGGAISRRTSAAFCSGITYPSGWRRCGAPTPIRNMPSMTLRKRSATARNPTRIEGPPWNTFLMLAVIA